MTSSSNEWNWIQEGKNVYSDAINEHSIKHERTISPESQKKSQILKSPID